MPSKRYIARASAHCISAPLIGRDTICIGSTNRESNAFVTSKPRMFSVNMLHGSIHAKMSFRESVNSRYVFVFVHLHL